MNNPTKNKNENIIGSSEIQPKAEGTMAFRIVDRFLGASASMPFVVHMETLNEDGSHHGFHNGDYCADMLESFKALVKRSAKYNLRVLDAQGNRIAPKAIREALVIA